MPEGAGITAGTTLNALSVDVEDYFHVEAFADRINPAMWETFPRRVVDNTLRLVELFGRMQARATFFILGWVAEREPSLVRRIQEAGHEVGCHSYAHRRLWQLTPEEFREDTRRAVKAIEDAGSQKVIGYRAPTFSVSERSLWAIDILAEEGFVYDSSVFPIRHDLYGMPGAPRFTFRWACQDGSSLVEVPLSTTRILNWNFPVGGGGYLRILPMWYTRWALGRLAREGDRPLVVYLHPWEIDPEQPRLPGKIRSRFRHYLGLSGMSDHIRELLTGRSFVPLRNFVEYELVHRSVPTLRHVGRSEGHGRFQPA